MLTLFKLFVICYSVTSVVYSAITNEERDKAYWGSSDSSNGTNIRKFRVEFCKDTITDLKLRLNNHRNFTPPLKGVAFNYGFNTDVIGDWLTYWANSYNFTERLAYINQYPQYKTTIQGLDIHFLWIKPQVSSDVKVVQLLLLHGWPGSVREFYEAIPLLTTNDTGNGFAVEVIAPSLPGFGFSDATSLPGLGATEMATVLKNLMKRLGYDQFYVQGGDWGGFIGSMMATLYPKIILGYHTNFAISLSPLTFSTWFTGALSTSLVVDSSVADRLYPLQTALVWLMTETGYLHIQSTKPDTIGVAMADSPAGMLAYILQLFSMSSRRENVNKTDGGLTLYSRDELLDNLMIYWISNSFTTSSRLYAETFNMRNLQEGTFAIPTNVPTWTAHTKNEMIYQSPIMLKFKFTNLLNSTIFDDYGHFFAFEQPDVFSNNVLTAIVAFENWYARYNATS